MKEKGNEEKSIRQSILQEMSLATNYRAVHKKKPE